MAKITGGLWGRITGAKMDKTEVKTAEKAQTKEKKKAKIPKVYQMYVGNTLRLAVPQIEGKEVIKSSHQVGDPSVAGVIHGVLMGRKGGETTVSSQFVYADENGQEETVRYEVPVQILVGKLKLKCNPATVYRMDGAQSLEERTSMSVAVGKTARIVPALDYGIFSSMRYEVEDEKIVSVRQDGLCALVSGNIPGETRVTAHGEIAGVKLERQMTVQVSQADLPISNPKSGENYTPEDPWEGDRVYFGRYQQNSNFAVGSEPILWRVLQVERDTILLLSEYDLESRNINDTFTEATWESCTMRRWLNTVFLEKAFTNCEISAIADSEIRTPVNKAWRSEPVRDVVDKVFLLSVGESTNPKYGFMKNYYRKSESRTVQNTQYATVNDGYTKAENGNTCWWLRTSGIETQFAYYFTSGCGTFSNFVGRRNDAVRPALRLRLDKISFAGNGERGGYPFVVVDSCR